MKNSKQHIVLDTNCLLQILSRRSENHFVWQGFLRGDYYLCVTTEILEEYEEIISAKMSPSVAGYMVELLLRSPYTLKYDAHYRWELITQDHDDNKFVDCAIAANASFIVSDDAHFKVLSQVVFPQVVVLRLERFASMLRAGN